MATKVFALILNYNNPLDSVEAARSLLSSDIPSNTQLVIIDNSETDNKKYFSTQLKDIVYTSSIGNVGFAAGNNLGINYALEHGATHVLLLNPDVRVPKVFLKPLLNSLKVHKKAGIVAPAHKEPGSLTYGLGGSINWANCTFPLTNTDKLPKNESEYDHLTFACVLMRVDVFSKIGLLDERYFMYLEDVDYCVRAKRAGYELWLNSTVCVTHNTSSSFADKRGKIKLSLVSCLKFIHKWYHFPASIIPSLRALYFYPKTYILWTLKLWKNIYYQRQ
ncbi:glycosyltransferase family 2 protein [Candidatus Woesebacteria bacterium]|nr:glycosyltransferase family 2 protein [Candidatus Woesebacteria bacterium]